jgi:hypothetical protein
MNFYQRRLGVLSKSKHQESLRLNILNSQIATEVLDCFDGVSFFLPKEKKFGREEEIEQIRNFYNISDKHARQILVMEEMRGVR